MNRAQFRRRPLGIRRRLPSRAPLQDGERPPVVDYADAEQGDGKPLAIDTMPRPLKPPGRK